MRISIEGLPGSGKTELLKLLKKTYHNVHFQTEDALHEDTKATTDKQDILNKSAWPQLVKTDPNRYIFGHNINKLLGQFTSRSESQPHGLHIYENSPYTIQQVLSPILLKKSYLHKEELKLQEALIDLVGWTPDCIIYLDCPPEVCLKRCAHKFAPNEGRSQLVELFDQYEWVLDQANCDIPVYRVNTNDDMASVLYNVSHIINHLNRDKDSQLLTTTVK